MSPRDLAETSRSGAENFPPPPPVPWEHMRPTPRESVCSTYSLGTHRPKQGSNWWVWGCCIRRQHDEWSGRRSHDDHPDPFIGFEDIAQQDLGEWLQSCKPNNVLCANEASTDLAAQSDRCSQSPAMMARFKVWW
mmetsp:Transcript_70344/g.139479  ORF Transcript_70344/g.139479 Transcript_70344/m.139479 type:complete len:135 (-) Transcript_70344:333-737(-)